MIRFDLPVRCGGYEPLPVARFREPQIRKDPIEGLELY
jgi:hypothetical protein